MQNDTIQDALARVFQSAGKNDKAIQYGQHYLTYEELDAQTTKVANALLAKGIESQTKVGILLENRVQFIIALLAVLKIRAIFVPLDYYYPMSRLRTFMEISETQTVISDRRFNNNLALCENRENLFLHFEKDLLNVDAPQSLVRLDYDPDDKISIYFTSGTTGTPKAVLGRNGSVAHFINWEISRLELNSMVRGSQFTQPGNDAFLRDLFVPLFVGGTVCIPEDPLTILESNRIRKWIEDARVDVVHCTPSLFKIVNSKQTIGNAFSDLKFVLLVGEAINPNELIKWYERLGNRIQLINLYGSTETSLAKFYYFIKPDDAKKERIPAGKALPGVRSIILNNAMEVCRPGEVGEVYIRTAYLSHGYYKQPQLNAEKFIPNPFGKNPNDLIYKTGDLGRMLPDGNLELLGRMDRQVKIRGNRIELQEIESSVLGIPFITDCVVDYRKEDEKDPYLVCYWVSDEIYTDAQLKQRLQQHLPEYMLPTYYIQVPYITLTMSGKVDYKSLPEPSIHKESDIVEPRNRIERKLLDIWNEVLELDQKSVTDSFLSLGGHSLKVMSLVLRIYEEFGIEYPLDVVFQSPTIEDMATYIETMEGELNNGEINRNTEEERSFPVTSAQKRLFLLNQLEGDNVAYNVPFAIRLEGKVDQGRLLDSLQKLITRHETLRTSFHMVDEQIKQIVHSNVELQLEIVKANENEIDDMIQQKIQSFDLSHPPLCKATLFKLEGEIYILLFDMHHIISDGSSISVIQRDLFYFYNEMEPPRISVSFKNYSINENIDSTNARYEASRNYWKNKLNGQLPVLNLPTDFPRPSVQGFQGDSLVFDIEPNTLIKLKELADNTNSTLFMVLISAFLTLLNKYTGNTDISVGTAISNRKRREAKPLVGMFVNTVVLRNEIDPHMSFVELLRSTKQTVAEAFQHQEFPFEDIIEMLPSQRDFSRNPLFDTMFILHNMDLESIPMDGELKVSQHPILSRTSKFDLVFNAIEQNGRLKFQVEFATSLFHKSTIQRWVLHYGRVLDSVAGNQQIQIKQISILPPSEEKWLMEVAGEAEQLPQKGIYEIFNNSVVEFADRPAVITDDFVWTYDKFSNAVNKLAGDLSKYEVTLGEAVGLAMSRSVHSLTAVIAILKLGGVCVPVDPEDQSKVNSQIYAACSIRIILCIENDEVVIRKLTNSRSVVPLENTAFIIHTSGSTGVPKGVLISQLGVLNHAYSKIKLLSIQADDIVSYNLNVQFVASIWQGIAPLLVGAAVRVCSEEMTMDPYTWLQQMSVDNVTIIEMTPSSLYSYLRIISFENLPVDLQTIRFLLLTGEKVTADLVNRYYSMHSTLLVNAYGQSECSDDTAHYVIPMDKDTLKVPIGKPVQNMYFYILDDQMQFVPIGVSGELYISGVGLADGYVNRELNQGIFISHPLGYNDRLYKTGDLARWLPDGNVEYIGRADTQVKIRGYRVELSEVEHHILAHEKINMVAVVSKKSGDQIHELIAYYLADTILEAREIRSFLTGRIPHYMIPSKYYAIKEMPLTKSGKADKRLLSDMDLSEEVVFRQIEEPISEIESKLIEIWKDVLNLEYISINDHFFELGGHSLKATYVMHRIQKKMQVEISLKDIFKYPTIRSLAKYIENLNDIKFHSIFPVQRKSYYKTSTAQTRLFALEQSSDLGNAYHLPGVIMIQGAYDQKRIKHAFKVLIERHEALRTSFFIQDGQVFQRIHEDVDFEVEHIQIKSLEFSETIIEEQLEAFCRPFNLYDASLFRVRLIVGNGNHGLLLYDMHHIISDRVSLKILTSEFIRIYNGDSLPEVTLQYRDFSEWQNKFLKNEDVKKQEDFWLKSLSDYSDDVELVTDYSRTPHINYSGASYLFEMDAVIKNKVLEMANALECTPYMICMAAFSIFLSKYSGRQDIVIGSPIAGRGHLDLENVVGLFVNTMPIRIQLDRSLTIRDFIKNVRKVCMEVFDNQDIPFDQIVELANPKKKYGKNPLFDVALVMQNIDVQEKNAPGISFVPYEVKSKYSKFELTLEIVPDIEDWSCVFEYRTQLFQEATIERFAEDFLSIMEDIVTEPENLLSTLSLHSMKNKITESSLAKFDLQF
ncbi:hypothetical protein BS614_26180 [Paenibacillus xylanexedens]|uniref:amino acid adenylation domain-containing protein n=1 Tax=Paenibacillus xylanexedens TaxID=528191 RepID=UPI0009386BB1|nr:non-ribosomal peptide synthetase [Paenibacillus xylanexedens]APO47194.1 hypothetical protein BS614_26180 [Paenibacillus xylanexedens]